MSVTESMRDVFAADAQGAPSIPATTSAPSAVDLAALRQFHFTGAANGVDRIEAGSFLPALLYPYRDQARVRTDYPLLVPAVVGEGQPASQPLGNYLRQLVEDLPVGKVLLDNLTRLELWVRRGMQGSPGRQSVSEAVAAAAKRLYEELGLTGESAARLSSDLASLASKLPDDAELIGDAPAAAIELFAAAVRQELLPRRQVLRQQIEALCAELEQVLQVERGKDDTAHDAEHVGRAIGVVGTDLVDPVRLAELVGKHRGTKTMAAPRRQQIETCLAGLRVYLDAPAAPLLYLIGRGASELAAMDGVVCCAADAPCAAGAAKFDELAVEWTELFRCLRRARLALDPGYDPERHDAWVDAFGWESFHQDELHAMPAVLVVDEAAHLVQAELPELSRLLLSGRRVHVLVSQHPGRDPASPGRHGVSFRLELAYLGMGHRQAFVQQATAARPDHLIDGYRRALAGTRAGLTVVDAHAGAAIGSWLHSRAAVESRAHPLYRYDPDRGHSWARRLEFDANPEVATDWSVQSLEAVDESAEAVQRPLAFTFADYALLDSDYAVEFTAAAAECEDLVDLAEYLALPEEEARQRLPCVYGVDQGGELTRLLPTDRLVRMTRERRGFWRTLQDLCGVRSETVDRAVAAAEHHAEQRFADERDALTASHDSELAELRGSAATEAMQGLAQMLLDTDVGALADLPLPAPASARAVPAELAAEPSVEVESAPSHADDTANDTADDEVEEAWVETVLCTSCNDCVTINDKLFVYDENKQIYLGDAKAGTFKQLVEAAEACPAKCIHPGQPIDKSEAGLEDLVQRAEPYN